MREQHSHPKKTTPAKKENSNSIKSNLLPQRCGNVTALKKCLITPSCRRVLSCLSVTSFLPPRPPSRPLLEFNHRQSLNSNRIDCNTTPSVINTSLAPVNRLSTENCDRFHPIPPTMQPFLPQFGTESPRTSCNNFFYSFHFRLR
jgi:hypothetical protein